MFRLFPSIQGLQEGMGECYRPVACMSIPDVMSGHSLSRERMTVVLVVPLIKDSVVQSLKCEFLARFSVAHFGGRDGRHRCKREEVRVCECC